MGKPLLVTINGTGSPGPFDPGFSGELGAPFANPYNHIYAQFVGSEVENLYYWQPIAYPAATFPMGPSWREGVNNVVAAVLAREADATSIQGDPLALSGYSQGAIVADVVWRDEILSPQGRLHHRLGDVVAIWNFGDPMRCPGICRGNSYAGFAPPVPVDGFTTGGIAGPADLTPDQTPSFLMSCNNDGDLYGAAPTSDNPWSNYQANCGVGYDETMIFNLVQDFNVNNVTALLTEGMTTLGVAASGGAFNLSTIITVGQAAIEGIIGSGGIPGIPSTGASTPDHVAAILLALLNGGLFVLHGFGPHGDYEKMVPAGIDFLTKAAKYRLSGSSA